MLYVVTKVGGLGEFEVGWELRWVGVCTVGCLGRGGEGCGKGWDGGVGV